MKNILFSMIALIGVLSYADDKAPEVFTPEIHRRGDEVRVVGEGPRGDVDEIKADALEPPADDSGMWFVTIWTTPNCSYCEKMKDDFKKAPELNAFVDGRGQMAWAHFNVYDGNDATQKWRKDQYKVTAYPTIVVQPPRNKRFGAPETVVFYQKGYDGNAAKLRDAIKSAVYRYVAKLVPTANEGGHAQGTVGVNPPFQVNPTPQPQPFPTYDPNQQFPPPVQPQNPSIPLPSQGTMTLVLFLAYAIWDVYRIWARGKGIPLVVDDDTKNQIKQWIKDALNGKAS